MDLMEITEKERLSREDAAARLHALADALAKHNDVEFDRGGMHFKVHVADEVDFKQGRGRCCVAGSRTHESKCASRDASCASRDALTIQARLPHAKWWARESQGRVVDACLQLHGGYGYMLEYPISRAHVVARINGIYGGSNEIMLEIVGRSLGLGEPRAGSA